jgi:hypothetical protein
MSEQESQCHTELKSRFCACDKHYRSSWRLSHAGERASLVYSSHPFDGMGSRADESAVVEADEVITLPKPGGTR